MSVPAGIAGAMTLAVIESAFLSFVLCGQALERWSEKHGTEGGTTLLFIFTFIGHVLFAAGLIYALWN